MVLLRFVLAGLIAGWVLGKIRRGQSYGILMSLAIGAVGSIIGWFLIGLLHIQAPTFLSQIGMAVAGAAVFFFLVASFFPKRRARSKDKDDD